MPESKIETPMLDKMRSVKEDSQKLGEFIDWLRENGMGVYAPPAHDYYGRHPEEVTDIEKLLARYFEIDLNKVEDERCALLDELRTDGR